EPSARTTSSRSNFAPSFTANLTCRSLPSARIVLESIHDRLVRAVLTVAGQPAQLICGTFSTTWFGPVVGIGSSEPRWTGSHPPGANHNHDQEQTEPHAHCFNPVRNTPPT